VFSGEFEQIVVPPVITHDALGPSTRSPAAPEGMIVPEMLPVTVQPEILSTPGFDCGFW